MVAYRGRTFYRQARYEYGPLMSGTVVPVFQKPGVRRSKSKPTRLIQEQLNKRNAVENFIRTVHLNFDECDYILHGTHREDPATLEDAKRLLANFLVKLRRRCRLEGLEDPKYLPVTEQGRSGRTDHHVFLSCGLGRDAIEKLWSYGRCNVDRLQFDENGVEPLARYVMKKPLVRGRGSRNLIRPEAIVDDGITRSEMNKYVKAAEQGDGAFFESRFPGWELAESEYIRNGVNSCDYVTFKMRRKREECEGKAS